MKKLYPDNEDGQKGESDGKIESRGRVKFGYNLSVYTTEVLNLLTF